MVPPDSHGVSRVPRYSGYSLSISTFAYRIFTFYDETFQSASTSFHVRDESPTTPTAEAIGLGSSLFARRYWGNRFFFLFLRVLRCFSSPGCPHTPMDSVHDTWILTHAGCPIRKFPDQCLLTAPRNLSQLTASFIDSWRQGIHHTLLIS